MPVSHELKTIFVHIPKTAGTSIEAVLGMHGKKEDIGIVPYFSQEVDREHLYGRDLQHLTAEQIRTVLEDDALFRAYFKFAIVRNPWDRLVSTCAWSDQKWARGQRLTREEFDEQVRSLHARFSAAKSSGTSLSVPPHLYPQINYLVDAGQNLLVDFVARYERLAEDWKHISRRLGVTAELPIRMKSHHESYREYYTEETREMAGQLYAADVMAFEYEF